MMGIIINNGERKINDCTRVIYYQRLLDHSPVVVKFVDALLSGSILAIYPLGLWKLVDRILLHITPISTLVSLEQLSPLQVIL